MNAILETPPTVKLDAPGQPALENARGFRVQQLEYGAPPQIDARAYAAAGNPGWGKTLYKLGGMAKDMHDARKLAEADLRMDRVREDAAAEVGSEKHKDNPQSWLGRVGELVKGAFQDFFPKDQDPQLNTRLQENIKQFTTELEGNVARSAVGREAVLLKQTEMLRFNSALEKEDFPKAHKVAQTLQGLLPAPELQEVQSRLHTARRTSVDRAATAQVEATGSAALGQVQAFYGRHADLFTPEEISQRTGTLQRTGIFTDLKKMTQSDPEGAELLAADRERKAVLTPRQRMEVQGLAEQQRQAKRRTQYETLHHALAYDELSPKEMAGTIAAADRLSPEDRTDLISFALEGPGQDPTALSRLNKEAANFLQSTASPDYALLHLRADTLLGAAEAAQVKQRAEQTASSKAPAMTQALGTIYSRADEHLDMEVFGPLTSKLGDMGATFSPKVRREIDEIKAAISTRDDPEWVKSHPKELEQMARDQWWRRQPAETRGSSYADFDMQDMAKARNAVLNQQQIMDTLNRRLDAGEIKDPQALQKHYYDLTAEDAAKRAGLTTLSQMRF